MIKISSTQEDNITFVDAAKSDRSSSTTGTAWMNGGGKRRKTAKIRKKKGG